MKNLIKSALLVCLYFSCDQVISSDIKFSDNFYGSSDPMERVDHRSNIAKVLDQGSEFAFAGLSACGWVLKETIKTIPNAAWFGAGSVGGIWLIYRLFFKRTVATQQDIKRVEVNISALRKLVELNHNEAKGWFEDLDRRVHTRFDSVDGNLKTLLSGQERHDHLLGSLDLQVKDVVVRQQDLQSSFNVVNAKQSSEHEGIKNSIDSLGRLVANGFSVLNSRMDDFGKKVDNAAERLSRLEMKIGFKAALATPSGCRHVALPSPLSN